jgi:hypothetical protein
MMSEGLDFSEIWSDFYDIASILYGTDRIENNALNSFSVVACVLAAVGCQRPSFWLQCSDMRMGHTETDRKIDLFFEIYIVY